MKQILLSIALVLLMSCAVMPEVQTRGGKPVKRSELIKKCVLELSDSHGLKEATESCLKIYSRTEVKFD